MNYNGGFNMRTVFENEVIKVLRTGSDYDLIAVVENKTDKKIQIIFDNELNSLLIDANDWAELCLNNDGYAKLEELETERFTVV
jgi:hypothetical protein